MSVNKSSWELIKQGAEAKVYKGTFMGTNVIIKERFPKSYRVSALDKKLTHQRLNQEARSISRCRKHGIRAPAIYHINHQQNLLYLEYISEGTVMKEYISSSSDNRQELESTMGHMGIAIATMHNADVIHGDLTTSNMIFDQLSSRLTLIDFGLSFTSNLIEDKGVDLYVLERAFLSTHPETEDLFQMLLDSYSGVANDGPAVINKLDEVRMRGRKRVMIG